MEPLAALGIAGNIVQFIDFSSKLISNASKIHHSVSGLPEDLEDAAAITKNLDSLMGRLPTPVLAPNASANDKSFAELISNCRGTCSDLQKLVEKIRGKQPASRMVSLGIAWRGMRWKGELEELEKRLDRYRSQLMDHLLFIFREEQSGSMKSMVKSQADLAGGLAQRMRDQFQETRRDILKILQSNTDASSTNEGLLREIRDSLENTSAAMKRIDAEKEVLNLLWFSDLRTRSNTIEQAHEGTYRWLLHEPEPEDSESAPEPYFSELTDSDVESSASQLNEAEIELDNKARPSSDLRGHTDQESYGEGANEQHGTSKSRPVVTRLGTTLPRLEIPLEPSKSMWRDRFTNWLQAGGGSFFISGKPGSGKSTLMKSIAHDPRTQELLQSWAAQDGKDLIFVSFFFWISGSPVQRSITGLYRSMLWEILQQAPELIKDVLPTLFRRASAGTLHESDFDLAHLEVTFRDLIRNPKVLDGYRVCIFIDGLDEYDGDHWALSRNLKSWCSAPDVKICLSSRPHNEFITIFGQPGPWLKLHELNQEDIIRVVRDQFANDERLVDARKLNSECNELIQLIVDKAEGVFVWVIMTMRSLLAGIGNSCSMAQLRKRLNSVPVELNAMFRSMLDGIELSERQAAARVFLTLKSLPDHSRIQDYVYFHAVMDDLVDNPVYEETLLDGKFSPHMGFEELNSKCVVMGRRLVGRCRGLIQIIERDRLPEFYNCVQFVHRTVRDFLGEPETLDGLRRMAGDFEPFRALVLGLISKVKHTPFGRGAASEPISVCLQTMVVCGCAERAGHPSFSAEIESLARMAVEFVTLHEDSLKGVYYPRPVAGFRRLGACTPGKTEAMIVYQAITSGALACAEDRLLGSKIKVNWALFLAFLDPLAFGGEPDFENRAKIIRLLLEQTTVAPNSELPPGSYHMACKYANHQATSWPRESLGLSPPWTLWILILMETSINMFQDNCYPAKQWAQVLELFLRDGADQSVCFVGYQLGKDYGRMNPWDRSEQLSKVGGDLGKIFKGPFHVDLPRMLAIWGLELEYDLGIGTKQGLWTAGRALLGALTRRAPPTIGELPTEPGGIWRREFLVLNVVPFHKIKDVQASELEEILKTVVKEWETHQELGITLYL